MGGGGMDGGGMRSGGMDGGGMSGGGMSGGGMSGMEEEGAPARASHVHDPRRAAPLIRQANVWRRAPAAADRWAMADFWRAQASAKRSVETAKR